MNYGARYRIVRPDGWILQTSDDPPTLEQLQDIARQSGEPVYLLAPDDDDRDQEVGYAGIHSHEHDYVSA